MTLAFVRLWLASVAIVATARDDACVPPIEAVSMLCAEIVRGVETVQDEGLHRLARLVAWERPVRRSPRTRRDGR